MTQANDMTLKTNMSIHISAFIILLILCGTAFCGTAAAIGDEDLLWKHSVVSNYQDAAVSPEGSYIAAGTYNTHVQLFDHEGGLLWDIMVDGPVSSLSVSESASYIAVGTQKGSLYLLDHDGEVLWTVTLGDKVSDVAISHNGDQIVAGSDNGYISLYKSDGEIFWNKRITGAVLGVGISADGKSIAAGSDLFTLYSLNETGAILWNADLKSRIYDVEVSPDGRTVIASSGNTAKIFDSAGEQIRKLVPGGVVYSVSVSSGLYATGTDKNYVSVYSDKSAPELHYPTFGSVNGVSLSANGALLAAASADGKLYVLSIPGNIIPTPHHTEPNATTPAPPGATGTVSISSSPSGAEVYLDNNLEGITPAALEDVSVGIHSMTIKLRGYTDWMTEVGVLENTTISVTAPLSTTPSPTPAGVSGVLTVLMIALAILVLRRK